MSLHPLLWIYLILDLIFMGFVDLSATESKRKIQNENMCLPR